MNDCAPKLLAMIEETAKAYDGTLHKLAAGEPEKNCGGTERTGKGAGNNDKTI